MIGAQTDPTERAMEMLRKHIAEGRYSGWNGPTDCCHPKDWAHRAGPHEAWCRYRRKENR